MPGIKDFNLLFSPSALGDVEKEGLRSLFEVTETTLGAINSGCTVHVIDCVAAQFWGEHDSVISGKDKELASLLRLLFDKMSLARGSEGDPYMDTANFIKKLKKQGMGCSIFSPAGDCFDAKIGVHLIKTRAGLTSLARTLVPALCPSEEDFWEMSGLTFPNTCFVEKRVKFKNFSSPYQEMRGPVLKHLSALNDSFFDAYESESQNSDRISARLNVKMSRESSRTKASGKKMGRRDVEYGGANYVCEWHTKIQGHMGRIHFFHKPIRTGAGERLLVGIFVDHLPI
ncbi:hypothetical protein ACUH91_07455 [Dermabacteraceae bacterium P9123]